MRVLLLMRGSAGCGKSTYIEQNGLKPYTLCADDIRLMCGSPVMNNQGKMQIDNTSDTEVWAMLFRLLEKRMQKGAFTVIDATNSKTTEINRYKNLCETYRYRMYCIDFTDIPIEVTKERNRMRDELKQVPDSAIDKFYSRFETQKIPAGVTVIKPDELHKIWYRKADFGEYNKIHIIGDIHGCYTAYKNYLDKIGGYKDDELYIFVGDFIDRGIENAEVVNEMIAISKKPNVIMLEGNHERWLWLWANDCTADSKEFELHTRYALEKAEVDKKEVRQLYRRLGQFAYFDYHGSTFLVTHGGMSNVPENPTLISTYQMTRGCGAYRDVEEVEKAFTENTPNNYYQIHGHRNIKQLPTEVDSKNYNLEGRVEFGGALRCVTLLPDGSIEVIETPNEVFDVRADRTAAETLTMSDTTTVGDMVMEMRKSRLVRETPIEGIDGVSSFNFTKDAFYDKAWNSLTTTARGLFVNIPEQRVVARAYNKFFNINERPETTLGMLGNRLRFPVTLYVKENGFLGIASYLHETGEMMYASKSGQQNEFKGYFTDMVHKKMTAEQIAAMTEYSKANNVSLLFEVVDMENDPHIIEYPDSRLYLLDIVKNDIKFEKMPYDEVCRVADILGIPHKEKAVTFDKWQDFFDFYNTVLDEKYLYHGRHIEGFVIEDSTGYMVKLKLTYYGFWKAMRNVAHEAIYKGYINRTSKLTTPLANYFYGWVKTLHEIQRADGNVPQDICTLRKLFFETEIGKQLAQSAENDGLMTI